MLKWTSAASHTIAFDASGADAAADAVGAARDGTRTLRPPPLLRRRFGRLRAFRSSFAEVLLEQEEQ